MRWCLCEVVDLGCSSGSGMMDHGRDGIRMMWLCCSWSSEMKQFVVRGVRKRCNVVLHQKEKRRQCGRPCFIAGAKRICIQLPAVGLDVRADGGALGSALGGHLHGDRNMKMMKNRHKEKHKHRHN